MIQVLLLQYNTMICSYYFWPNISILNFLSLTTPELVIVLSLAANANWKVIVKGPANDQTQKDDFERNT